MIMVFMIKTEFCDMKQYVLFITEKESVIRTNASPIWVKLIVD